MKALLAEFASAEGIIACATEARAEGFPLLDALTPYPLPRLMQLVGSAPPRMRGPMAIAGFAVALLAFGFQWWTLAYAYPFNSGGRPSFSWPVFVLVPFEVGVLAAALAGFVAFLIGCGFPRLHHPVFDVPGIERASQDRFFLLIDPLDHEASVRLQTMLFQAGARQISETIA